MEYIQCNHCHKKYRVNEQVRAAAGRMVKCKDCGEAIEIVIFESPSNDVPTPVRANTHKEYQANKPNVETPKNSEDHQEKKPQTKHEKYEPRVPENGGAKKRITLSAVFGGLIVLASLYGFFQGRSQQAEDLHHPTTVKNTVQDKRLAQPNGHDKPALPSQSDALSKMSDLNRVEGNHYSTYCKEAAAQQWLTDFSMSHGEKKGRDYMALLDQGIQTSALIRQNCGGSHVVAEVLQTAQEGVPPEWLVHTLNELTQGDTVDTPRF